jgi:hypothetical protein
VTIEDDEAEFLMGTGLDPEEPTEVEVEVVLSDAL